MKGRLIIDPPDYTRKHIRQSEWKKVAIIQFSGDFDAMWRWYLNKSFGLELNQPLRRAHVTVINDKVSNETWNKIKPLNGKLIDVDITNELRGNGEHWWLRVNPTKELEEIRSLVNLGEPFFKYHLTIGLANSRNIEHSKYILRQMIRYDTRNDNRGN